MRGSAPGRVAPVTGTMAARRSVNSRRGRLMMPRARGAQLRLNPASLRRAAAGGAIRCRWVTSANAPAQSLLADSTSNCSKASALSTTTSAATSSSKPNNLCSRQGSDWSFMSNAGGGFVVPLSDHIALRMNGRHRYVTNHGGLNIAESFRDWVVSAGIQDPRGRWRAPEARVFAVRRCAVRLRQCHAKARRAQQRCPPEPRF